MQVELIYDADCPNVGAARDVLRQALAEAGSAGASWTEWCRDDPSAPPRIRAFGSPTVLVDGRDVAPAAGADGSAASCRLYRGIDGKLKGVPPLAAVLGKLRAAGQDTVVVAPLRNG